MLPELGHFSLILSWVISILLSFLPIIGVVKQNNLKYFASTLAVGQCFFILISLIILSKCFFLDDFSVLYVAMHSNSALPWYYKFSALWAGHEGSFLLLIGFLSLWTVISNFWSKHLSIDLRALMLAILGIINSGFTLFVLFVSNPFIRLFPNVPLDGQDLNPLLQDPGLIIHPPMLFLGYIGFAVPFAWAVACILLRENPLPMIGWIKKWVLAAWLILTLGITLGSFWAYYELGWGGFWFWDPVENVSLIPWLSCVALIHSLLLTDKTKKYCHWSYLLMIVTFGFCLLGIFFVRSSILSSVHAFASDPKRGICMLYLLAIYIGSALIIYVVRQSDFNQTVLLKLKSQGAYLVANILFFLIALLVVLLGTLYPLMVDVFTGHKISVGYPYFNIVFGPLMVASLIFMAPAVYANWGVKPGKNTSIKWLIPAMLLSVLGQYFLAHWQFKVWLASSLSLWVILATCAKGIERFQQARAKVSVASMMLAHIGMAITFLGVILTTSYQVERDLQLTVGDSMNLGKYQVKFENVKVIQGVNYAGHQGEFGIYQDGAHLKTLLPEKRRYLVQDIAMSETAIDGGWLRDIYVALGEPLTVNSWSCRIYLKPFIRWIWAGALCMAIGGLMGLLRKKYESKVL